MKPSWPADRVERWSIARLAPNARNARTHSPAQVKQLAASIEEWGWTIPVLVDEVGGIIAGHGRVMAAHRLGIEDVPVMVAAGWSEAKKRAYMLADNQLTLNSEWDLDRLAIEIAELHASDFDISLIGFNESEIEDLLKADGGALTDPEEAPEPPSDPVSKTGDVWLLGAHRLVCGDCTDPLVVDKALNGVKPHLMVTDPPYGVGFERGKFMGREKRAKGTKFSPIANDDLRGAALAEFIGSALDAWDVEAGTVYLWSPSLVGYLIKHGIEAAGFKVQSQIVWRKTPFVIGRTDYHWQHEICWYAFKGRNHPWYGGRDKGTVGYPQSAENGRWAPNTKARRVHEAADRKQFLAGSSGLRSFRRLRHCDHRGGNDRPRVPRDRTSSALCRRECASMAELHGQRRDSGGDGRDVCRGGGSPVGAILWFRYVRHEDRARFESEGWRFAGYIGLPHGHWAVLMQAPEGFNG